MHREWDDERITAFGMLLEAYAAVVGNVSRDLDATSDLALSSLGILLRLARSPDRRLRMTELAAQAALSTSGLTRLVDRLEEVGYLRREACASDRRSSLAVLTDQGAEVLVKAVPGHLDSLERNVAGPLGAEGVQQLTAMLEVLRDSARRGPAPAAPSFWTRPSTSP
ncbi:MAG: MarR family transcriptional regulator [Actinomycetota bacterium]|nr:MarR family transcriptional regulator [Actinomycetota bacterium]